MKQGQFPAVLNLTDLNGQNGFKIDGETVGSAAGESVSIAGDVNGDGYSDILVGAWGYNNNTGRSYVIFGGTQVGAAGLVSLSNLNGVDGFKIDGEIALEQSGYSLGAVGDINGDGYDDLLIGAPAYNNWNTGRCYLVYGGPQIGSNGLLSLANLTGINGFKINSEVNSGIGSQISPGYYLGRLNAHKKWDINGDGNTDLLIGGHDYNNGRGRTYVIFGGSQVGSSGLLNLTYLNTTTGFKIDGENAGDNSGMAVSPEGDLNADGYDDLLIQARFYNQTGRNYIVFGGPNITYQNPLLLASLNGTNGFKLDNEAMGDMGLISDGADTWLDGPGDINQDGIADLLIGAYGHQNDTGRSYIVFGHPNIGKSGYLPLASLNGSNGFKLDGETIGERSGQHTSSAGDFNGDGIPDLLLGAPSYNAVTGRCYVIFGGSKISPWGLLPLSTLNGIDGFKIDGETVGDQSGIAVSPAGDVNGDGMDDLIIGAQRYNSWTGRAYVIFGDAPPVLINNSLTLSTGAAITLNATYLAATDLNHNNNTLVFIPSGVSHGQFETINNPGIPLVNFTQQQVTSGAIQFVHDGMLVPPSYNITVRSTGIAWTGPLPAQINFIGTPQTHFPAIISLVNLNGQNGFKIDGEVTYDVSGHSVSTAGDINGDSYADLLIGAYGYPNGDGKGRSYVVLGKPGIGSSGLLELVDLNGTNGFKLDGEAQNDWSGFSTSAAGDINGDGQNDLLIGAPWHGGNVGRSYAVFGGVGVGQGGVVSLGNLTSVNGFKFDGEAIGDGCGWSVAAGDINGDGYSDLLIGAPNHDGYVGRSYVIFGGTGMAPGGLLPLASLNGTNGFKLDGETSYSYSGYSVSSAEDVNGDGYADLLIGSYGYANNSGCSYVVFGGPGIGQSGFLSLSNLTGINGFKLYGETVNDYSGNSVSSAGDINGDGYGDLLIGAYGHSTNTGRSYVVFGGSGIGQGGLLQLASLNGTNGFKLDGEVTHDESGYSVSAAGDINGDGYHDLLIGAYFHANHTGCSYVIFGGSEVGQGSLLSLSSIKGVNGFKLVGEIVGDESGVSVSAGGDINGDSVDDLLIGAYLHASQTGRSYVIFGDVPPTLVQNRLSLALGQTIFLNQTYLSAYDRNNPNNTIVFIPTNMTHGRFQLSTQPGVSLANFTLPQLQSGVVQFVHDGSVTAPSYDITVQSAGIAWTGPHSANISFTVPFTIVNNQLTLNNGQTVVLSLNNLQAVDPGVNNNSQIIFTVGNVQNGYFVMAPAGNSPSKNVTSFTQAQIADGEIEFVSAGNNQTPGYSVIVSDGIRSTAPSVATIYFAGAPIITQNVLNITAGETITLTPAVLNVTVTDGSTPSQVVLTVSNLQHAVISSNVTGMPVNNFTLAQLEAGQIQLTQEGGLVTPSYTITAKGVQSQSSAPSQATVYFSNQGVYAPQLVNNYLTVTQGESTILSNQYLSAQEPSASQALSNSTMFYVSNIEYGHFSLTSQHQTWITAFSQQQLLDSQVQFVQDGSASTPGYQTAVQAFGLQSASLDASIFFTPVNVSPPILGGNSGYTTIQKAIISAVVSGTIGILFTVVQVCLKRAANKKLANALGDSTDQYDLTVVRPVAKEIARQIKITGFMNHTTNTKMVHFKSAVRTILFELTQRGVDLDFAAMNSAVRDGLINEIARQTRRVVLSDKGCCNGCSSFFKAQATPKEIEEAAPVIAEAVVQKLRIRTTAESSAMELPKLSSSQNILLADRSTHSIPPPSPTVLDNLNEERIVAQVL